MSAATLVEVAVGGDESVDTFFDAWRDEGHRVILDTVRRELETRAPSWAAGLDDRAVLDPILVACIMQAQPELELSQCLWGLVPSAQRPAELVLTTLADGRVLLPGLGFMGGAPPSTNVTLVQRHGEPALREHPEAWLEPFPRVATNAGRLEVFPHKHPLLRPFIEVQAPCYEEAEIDRPARRNLAPLDEGLALIARVAPRQHAEILRDTRLVVITQHDQLLSLVGMRIHGAVFINVRDVESALFFAEELVHQSGHVTFGKVLLDWPQFLAVPIDTPMPVLTGDDTDTRNFGDAFHGNYTLVRMVQLFDRLFELAVLRGARRRELLGRATMATRRLAQGLRQLGDERFYTAKGWSLHQRLQAAFDDVMCRVGHRIAGVDISNQPYAFDFARFCEANPI